jgi:protein SCO1/2
MKSLLSKYRIFIIFFLVFSVVTIGLFYSALKPAKSLPIFNPADVNPEMVDSTVQYKTKYHTISDFSFTNQNGKTITQKDYEGKIYVADFFFTTCGSICPKMTTNLVEVQKAFSNNPKVMILSHSVLPDVDDVSKLKAQLPGWACTRTFIDGFTETINWLRDNPRRQRINPTLLKALNNLDSITKL